MRSMALDSSEEEPKQWKGSKGKTKKKWWCCKLFKTDKEDADAESKTTLLSADQGSTEYENLGTTVQEEAEETEEEYDIHTSRKQVADKLKDSDYYSSDTSTDYSYSYQYNKDQDEIQLGSTSVPFKDIEKQHIPDYATMENFRDDIEDEALIALEELDQVGEIQKQVMEKEDQGQEEEALLDDEELLDEDELLDEELIPEAKKSTGTVISGTTFKERKKQRRIDFIGVPSRSTVTLKKKLRKRKKKKEEEIPLLESDACLCSDSDDSNLRQSYKAPITSKSTTSTTTDNLHSLLWTSSTEDNDESESRSDVLDSENKDDLKYIQTLVPELDFSTLIDQNVKKSSVEDKFSNVIYQETSESPKSTSSGRNLTSSSHVSSVKDESVKISENQDQEKLPAERKHLADETPTLQPLLLPHSSESHNREKNQKQRAREYYKAVKEIPTKKIEEERKPNRFMKFFQKIFPKRKRNPDNLPSNPADKEIIELKSYNYSRDHWDTLSSSSSAYVGQVNLEESPANLTSSDEEEEIKRIRGGESGLSKNSSSRFRQRRSEKSTLIEHSKSGHEILKNLPNLVPKSEDPVTNLFSKYFVAIEDLTPTRDCDSSMTTVETLQPTYGTNELLTREIPEKDQQGLSPVTSLTREVCTSSSSNLSADLISNILGNSYKKRSSSIQTNLSQSVHLDAASNPHLLEPNQTEEINPSIRTEYLEIIEISQNPKQEDQASAVINQSELVEISKNLSQPKESKITYIGDTVISDTDISGRSNNNNTEQLSINNTGKSNSSTRKKLSIKNSEQLSRSKSDVLSRTESIKGTSINQSLSKSQRSSRGNSADQRSGDSSRASQKKKKSCKCEAARKDQQLQTYPKPIIKITPPPDDSVVTIKEASIASQKSQTLIEPDNIEVEMADASHRSVSKEDTTEKYPVRESARDISSENRQKLLSTSNKMQQTSTEGIYRLDIPVQPTSSNSASNKTTTNSTKTRASSINNNRPSTCIETTETAEPTSSSNFYCSCCCAEQDMANNQCSYKCCKCSPPPPPRYEQYVTLRDQCCRSVSPPETYPKCVTYAENHHRCCRDVPSDHTIRSTHRKMCRNFPVEDAYPFVQQQHTEFKRSPCDACSSESSRRSRPLEPDRLRRRQSPGNRLISPCNGDCRCCIKNRKPRQAPLSAYRFCPDEYQSSSSDISDEVEDDDNNSYSSDDLPNRFDLPYQNNDEYLELVQELEETLQSRNRNRVRRAMQEFEHRSRYNKPLEQPIINYDETSESEEPIIEKLSKLRSKRYKCCGREVCTCRHRGSRPFAKCSQNKVKEQRPRSRGHLHGARCRQKPTDSAAKTHWQLDQNSGEWYKVSENQQRRKCQRSRTPSRRRSTTPSPQRDYCPHNCNCCGTRGYEYR